MNDDKEHYDDTACHLRYDPKINRGLKEEPQCITAEHLMIQDITIEDDTKTIINKRETQEWKDRN